MLCKNVRQSPLDADQRSSNTQGLDLAGATGAGRRVEPPRDLVEVAAIARHGQHESRIDTRCRLSSLRRRARGELPQHG